MMAPTVMPNIATEMATNAKWYHIVTLKMRVRMISYMRVASVTRPSPMYVAPVGRVPEGVTEAVVSRRPYATKPSAGQSTQFFTSLPGQVASRLEVDVLFKVGPGRGRLTALLIGERKGVVGLGKGRINVERGALLADRVVKQTLLKVVVAEVTQSHRAARIQPKRGLEFRDRLREPPLAVEFVGLSQMLERSDECQSVDVGGAYVLFALTVAKPAIGTYEEGVDRQELLVSGEGALEIGDRLPIVPGLDQREADVVEEGRILGQARKRPVMRDRSRKVALLPIGQGQTLRRMPNAAVNLSESEGLDRLVIITGLETRESQKRVTYGRPGFPDVSAQLGLDRAEPAVVGEGEPEMRHPICRIHIAVLVAADDLSEARGAPQKYGGDVVPVDQCPRRRDCSIGRFGDVARDSGIGDEDDIEGIRLMKSVKEFGVRICEVDRLQEPGLQVASAVDDRGPAREVTPGQVPAPVERVEDSPPNAGAVEIAEGAFREKTIVDPDSGHLRRISEGFHVSHRETNRDDADEGGAPRHAETGSTRPGPAEHSSHEAEVPRENRGGDDHQEKHEPHGGKPEIQEWRDQQDTHDREPLGQGERGERE